MTDITPAYSVARISAARQETPDTTTLSLTGVSPDIVTARPGQFVVIGLPSFEGLPMSISRFNPDGIDLSIRAIGPRTRTLAGLRRGAKLLIRGPYGNGWPVETAISGHALVVAGGCGLAPARALIDALRSGDGPFRSVRLLYGARAPEHVLFADELRALAESGEVSVSVIVERGGGGWAGPVGLVTALVGSAAIDPATTAFVCGPEPMMVAIAGALVDRVMAAERIYLSVERRVQCAVGNCGSCKLDGYLVCQDGPVFALPQLVSILPGLQPAVD